MNNLIEIPPIYPITDTSSELPLSEQVSRFADAGFPLVQFRGKPLSVGCQWRELRTALIHSIENGGWPLIVVNDRADLAVLAANDGLAPWGLHLGQSDLPASTAAQLPGLNKLHFGASTHNPKEWSSIDQACDHAGVGPLRATATKRDHDKTIGFDGLYKGCAALRKQNIASIAIGGLTMDDALPCFQSGAGSLAMTSALSPLVISAYQSRLTECLWRAQKIKYARNTILKKGGVIIVGGSGAGKTMLAKALAPRLGIEAIDLDLRISQKTGKSIVEIFTEYNGGEAQFRTLEAECLPECLERPAVIALGAGAWQQIAIRRLVKNSGWNVYWLAENPDTAWERVKADPARPLARDRAEFMQRWRSRMDEWCLLPSLLPLGRQPDELADLVCTAGFTCKP